MTDCPWISDEARKAASDEAGDTAKSLGPHYFDARLFADNLTSTFEEEHFKPIVDKLVGEVQDKLWDAVQYSLISDVSANVQSEIWREVDAIVTAILGGEQWALQRHVLGDRYDLTKVRKALATLIPEELQAETLKDLTAQVAKLEADLAHEREWNRR